MRERTTVERPGFGSTSSLKIFSLENDQKLYEQTTTSNSEALSFAINVAETQVDVRANALHRLDGQGTSQVFGVRPRCRQAKAKPGGENKWHD